MCGLKIDSVKDAWDEHVIRIADHSVDSGDDPNRWSNRDIAHAKCARAKTSAEAKSSAKHKRAALKHFGAQRKTGFRTNRAGRYKKLMDGRVMDRETGEIVG